MENLEVKYPENTYNLGLEQMILGNLILYKKDFDKIKDIILPEYFYNKGNQIIFQLIKELILGEENIEIDVELLFHLLSMKEECMIEKGYLYNLTHTVVARISLKIYAEILKELYLKRQVIERVTYLSYNLSYTQDISPLLNQTSQFINNIQEQLYINDDHDNISSILQNYIMYLQDNNNEYYKTNFIDLDKILGGLHSGDLIVLAARPAMGKTAFAINIAYNLAMTNHGVLFLSLEMSNYQIVTRLISKAINLPSEELRKGNIATDKLQLIIDFHSNLNKIPLFIRDKTPLTLNEIINQVSNYANKNIKIVIIDYLQLINSDLKGKSKNDEVSFVTRELKLLAKKLNITILLLSQLSRNTEKRDDKKPQLSDLRDSGSIEQDADVVMFLYREIYYLGMNEPSIKDPFKQIQWKDKLEKYKNIANLIIAKHRNGATGNIELFFDPNYSSFNNLEINHKL